jgi:serine/threonine-protein kinase
MHSGIVPVYSRGRFADGRAYFAMRYVEGNSLRTMVTRFQAEASERPAGRVEGLRRLVRHVADAGRVVHYAHDRGVLHRDLKPHNLLITPYGETMVLDWGLAASFRRPEGADRPLAPPLEPEAIEELTAASSGRAVGTAAYLSPEAARGDLEGLGPPSDVYGLGATLYVVLTGRSPIEATTPTETLRKAMRESPPSPQRLCAWLPPALEAVCLKAMSRRPEDRYSTCLEMAEDLERWRAREPVSANRDSARERVARWLSRRLRGAP